jgi:GT2 family glycosyltransferase
MKQTVGIVIVNYSGTKDTLECLDSLKKVDSEYSLSIYVVHYQPNAGVTEVTNHFVKPQVITTEENLGFGGMSNLGITQALKDKVDYVMLLNNDTVVDPNFIDPLIQQASKKNAGLVSPLIYFYKGQEYHLSSYESQDRGKVIWYGGGVIDWQHFLMFHNHVDEVDRGQIEAVEATDFATGCCALARSEVVKTIGMLPEKYFMYMEDVAWSMEAKRKGYGQYIVSNSHIWHKNAQSSGGVGSDFHVYYQQRNRILFTKKYGGFERSLAVMKYAITNLLRGVEGIERKALIDGVLGKSRKSSIS